MSQLSPKVNEAESRKYVLLASQGPVLQIAKKACLDLLWNAKDYISFLGRLTATRHIFDVHSFVNLINEGNEAIRAKEAPSSDAA